MKNFVKIWGIIAVLAVVIAACSTDSKTVIPKKPDITDHPQNFMCGQGDTVLLTVIATTRDKKAKLSYQWYSNTKKNAKGGTKVPSASGTLVSGEEGGHFEPPTNTIGEFYYYVEVTSALGREKAKTNSEVAVITVLDSVDMPVISASNGDPTTTQGGDDIVLTVTVNDDNDDPVVSYQWYSNTRNSNSGGTKIPDAVEASYQPPTDVQGTMYYYVVITTESGKSLTSLPMRVSVITNVVDRKGVDAPPPSIPETGHPKSATYYVGQPVTPLTVTATVKDVEDTPNIVIYQWYRNTERRNTGGEQIIGADDTSYTPPNNEAGTFYYYVVITNEIEDNGDDGRKIAETRSAVAVITFNAGRDAQAPSIVTQPVSASYIKDQKATALSAKALSPDEDGTVTYQWYKKLSDNPLDTGEPLEGETEQTYMPSTDEKGVSFFYVKFTNTIPDSDPPDGGKKSVSVDSNTVYVTVGVTVMTLNVPVSNKAYDGTTTATVGTISAGSFSPSTALSGATVHVGTATFAQAEVGNDIPVTLEGWYLTGDNKDDYLMTVAGNVKRNITKAAGAAVSAAPTVAAGAVPGHSITVNAVTLAAAATDLQKAQQSVEYARGTANNTAADQLTWQSSPTFNGLNCTTNYYIYARSTATANYNAGTYSVSAIIATGQPSILFETNGGIDVPYAVVTKGSKFPQPSYAAATRAGYTFDCWYTDAALTTPYNFDAVVNNNVTLYARWVPNAVVAEMNSEEKGMEWIRGGNYMMGSPTTEPGRRETAAYKFETQRWVVLNGYFMGRHEVTQEKWQAVMGSNPSNNKTGSEVGTPEKLPVENVSWYEALVFCNKLSIREDLNPAYSIDNKTDPSEWGAIPVTDSTAWNNVTIVPGSNGYRLPTEAQWEWACRAGTETAYNTGNTINADTGWYGTNQTHKVGMKPANAWGLYDMHGNVAEWCQDFFSYSPATVPAVSVNPVTTVKVDQSYSRLVKAYDPHMYDIWPNSVPHNFPKSQLEALIGRGQPSPPYLRLLIGTGDYEVGKWCVLPAGYQNATASGTVYGNSYYLWVTADNSPIRDARIVRGGGYDYDATRLRSASRVTPIEGLYGRYYYTSTNPYPSYTASGQIIDDYSAALSDIPTALVNSGLTPKPVYSTPASTFGVCRTVSQGRYNNVGLRLVRPYVQ